MAGTIDRRPIAPPNDRRARDLAVMVGIGIILLFAVVGVVSAGAFLGGKVAGKSSTTPTSTVTTGNATARQDLARAQTQATQIVRSAQVSGKTILKREQTNARKQAAAIIAAAKTRAATISSASAPSSSSTTSQQASSSGSSSSGTGTSSSSRSAFGSTGRTTAYGSPPSATANLNGLPSTWLVVAYNPTFGSGPGTAGSITVTNRSSRTFSGTARVTYASGGSASASFSGLVSGQTVVLPLNGPTYTGGGVSIRVVNPH